MSMRKIAVYSKFICLVIFIFLQSFVVNNVYAINKTTATKSSASSSILAFVELPHAEDIAAGDKQNLVYVIQNQSSQPSKIVIGGFSSPITRDTNVPNNCGTSLTPGAMCYIKLLAASNEEVTVKQVLNVGDGAQTLLSAPINFQIHALKIIYKDSIDTINAFPEQSITGKVQLQNTSNSTPVVNLEAVANLPSIGKFSITKTTCSSTLSPQTTCFYEYTYLAPPATQISSGFVRANAAINFSYNDNKRNVSLEYPIQILQSNYGHFVILPVDTNGYKKLPSNVVHSVIVRGNTIYVATGMGLGISKDGGDSWTNYTFMQGFASNEEAMFGQGHNVVYVNNDNSKIYVASLGLHISDDRGKTWKYYDKEQGLSFNTLNGVFASNDGMRVYVASDKGLNISIDGGKTWKLYVIPQAHGSIYISDVFASDDGSRIYAATQEGVGISTDFGATWKVYDGTGSFYGVSKVYVNNDGSKIYAATTHGLWISDDGGKTWSVVESDQPLNDVYASADGMRIYTAGYSYTSISIDGGKNWRHIPAFPWSNGAIFATSDGAKIYNAKIYNPLDGEKLGGLLISGDGGDSWTRHSAQSGLTGDNNVYSVYNKGHNIYATTEEGLVISNDDGTTWKNYVERSAPIGFMGISGLYVSPDETRIYAAMGNKLSVSIDAGKNWKDYTKSQGLANNDILNVYASPDGSRIYAVGGALSVSTDSGKSWSNYTTEQGLLYGPMSSVYASGDGINIYVSLGPWPGDSGGVSISHDSGTTWKNYTTEQGLVSSYVEDISVNKNGDVIYAGTVKGISGSFDGGVTWKTHLLDIELVWKIFTNNDGTDVYAATFNGLFISNNSGESWKKYAIFPGLYSTRTATCLSVYATPDNSKVYVGLLNTGLAFTYMKK